MSKDKVGPYLQLLVTRRFDRLQRIQRLEGDEPIRGCAGDTIHLRRSPFFCKIASTSVASTSVYSSVLQRATGCHFLPVYYNVRITLEKANRNFLRLSLSVLGFLGMGANMRVFRDPPG